MNFGSSMWFRAYSDILKALLVQIKVLLVDFVHDQLVKCWNIAVHTVILYNRTEATLEDSLSVNEKPKMM